MEPEAEMRAPLRVCLMSDTHLEFLAEKERVWQAWLAHRCEQVAALRPDVIILAGDIGWPRHAAYAETLARFAHLVPAGRLLVVPGNHEYYDPKTAGVEEARRLMRGACEAAGAVLLDGAMARVGDVFFVGATLWSRVPEPAPYAKIHNDDRHVPPFTRNAMHERDAAFLRFAVRSCRRGAKALPAKVVVVTHHPPQHATAVDDPLRLVPHVYAQDMEDVAPDVWIYGHLHRPRRGFDDDGGGDGDGGHMTAFPAFPASTRFISCTHGYPDEVEEGWVPGIFAL